MTEKRKKKKQYQEKPRYGMWNNAWFMIGKAWKYEKSVLAVLVMSIILEVIMNLLNLLYRSGCVKRAGRGMDVKKKLFRSIFIFAGGMMLVGAAQGYLVLNSTVWTD